MTDFSKILEKAKEVEAKMKESQEKIKKIEVIGVSGGEAVKVTLNGEGEMVNLDISDEVIKEEKGIIVDLIRAAHANAKNELKSKTSDEISKDFVNSETLILLSTIFPFLSTVIKSLTVGKNLYLLFNGGRHASSPFV